MIGKERIKKLLKEVKRLKGSLDCNAVSELIDIEISKVKKDILKTAKAETEKQIRDCLEIHDV